MKVATPPFLAIPHSLPVHQSSVDDGAVDQVVLVSQGAIRRHHLLDGVLPSSPPLRLAPSHYSQGHQQANKK